MLVYEQVGKDMLEHAFEGLVLVMFILSIYVIMTWTTDTIIELVVISCMQ